MAKIVAKPVASGSPHAAAANGAMDNKPMYTALDRISRTVTLAATVTAQNNAGAVDRRQCPAKSSRPRPDPECFAGPGTPLLHAVWT